MISCVLGSDKENMPTRNLPYLPFQRCNHIGNAQTKVNKGLRMPLDWIAHPHQSAKTKEFALEHTYPDNRAEISANHSKEILREAA